MSERDAAGPLEQPPDTVDGLLAAILHLATGQRGQDECTFNRVLVLLEELTEDAENSANEINGPRWLNVALDAVWNAQHANREREQFQLPHVNATADATLVNLRAALAALTIGMAERPFDYSGLDDTE